MGGVTTEKTNMSVQQKIELSPPSSGDARVAVAVCKDENSRHAVKWALEKLVGEGDRIILMHVRPPTVYIPTPIGSFIPISQVSSDAVDVYRKEVEAETANLLKPFQQLCKNKKVQTKIVVLEDDNIPNAILKYVSNSSINKLAMGASSRNAITRKLKGFDIPANVARKAPKFCSVYVISKGKLTSVHSNISPVHDCDSVDDIKNCSSSSPSSQESILSREETTSELGESTTFHSQRLLVQRNQGLSCVNQILQKRVPKSTKEILDGDEQISRLQDIETDIHNRLASSPREIKYADEAIKYSESSSSSFSRNSDAFGEELISFSLPDSEVETVEGLENSETASFMQPGIKTELERMKIEVRNIREKYTGAVEKAIAEKRKAESLNARLLEESRKLEEAKVREEMAIAMAAEDKANCEAVMKDIEAAKKDSEKEIEQRRDAELKAIRDSYDRKEMQDTVHSAEQRYRKYSIEEIESATVSFSESLKIGEGGYGPVYKCTLDHISVAIKVLRTDAARGRQEFQQEVEILSRIHHPNMVLLLGACPERGCLVYEYMANGSLEDRLFQKDASVSLPWFVRFRIASEIASALLFLHSNKPEPIVHRDLKPANILLDQNFVSKIADVGLARLVPPEISSTFTEYNNTLLCGTFFYIDPEYTRTGTLRPKSDLYALGIILLQLLTAKPAMAIPDVVEKAIQNGSLKAILDKSAGDWPLEEATDLAKLALKCTELRRRDRPDLETIVLPELQRFKDVANSHVQLRNVQRDIAPPSYFICPILQAVMEDPYIAADGVTYEHKAIKAWLEKHDSPPMGDPKLTQKHLLPNRSLRSAIVEWRLGSDALPLSELTQTLNKGRK